MSDLYIGMLSGTSRDGVDLVLTRFDDDRAEVLFSRCQPYPEGVADFLDELVTGGRRPEDVELKQGDKYLSAFFSQAVMEFLAQAGVQPEDIKAIGSHGQTVWHAPPESIQLGDPAVIAAKTGIVTVGRFRQADLAAGGQGAPLAPLLHRWIFPPDSGTRIVLNLGGIANISVLGSDGSVRGFDTGPANCLLDAWIRGNRGQAFDRDGEWSASGTVDPMLLLDLMSDPFFKKPPPKSTGIEYFNLDWLTADDRLAGIDPADVQATLAQLTASTVAAAVTPFNPVEVVSCGGGSHNRDIIRRLDELLTGCQVQSTDAFGLDPDCVEGVLFAWLARERLAGLLQDTRQITGAREPVLLGEVFHP